MLRRLCTARETKLQLGVEPSTQDVRKGRGKDHVPRMFDCRAHERSGTLFEQGREPLGEPSPTPSPAGVRGRGRHHSGAPGRGAGDPPGEGSRGAARPRWGCRGPTGLASRCGQFNRLNRRRRRPSQPAARRPHPVPQLPSPLLGAGTDRDPARPGALEGHPGEAQRAADQGRSGHRPHHPRGVPAQRRRPGRLPRHRGRLRRARHVVRDRVAAPPGGPRPGPGGARLHLPHLRTAGAAAARRAVRGDPGLLHLPARPRRHDAGGGRRRPHR